MKINLANSGNARQRETMRAWRIHAFGGPDALRLDTVVRPTPGPGEVLIKVAAAGVGPWDGWIRAGQSALPQPLPLTLGSDLAGTVVAIGDGVSEFVEGERVFGATNAQFTGAQGEYALAEAGRITQIPPGIDDITAASLPVVAATAWQALFDEAHLRSGQSVLIHGAAGNVGRYAVQLARSAGLRVLATAAEPDRELLFDLGADLVIDFRNERFEDRISTVDAVIDLVGGDTQARSFTVLRRGGRLVSAVAEPDQELARRHRVAARFFLVDVKARILERIATAVTARKLASNVGLVLPCSEAPLAHEILDGQRPRIKGKIVLQMI